MNSMSLHRMWVVSTQPLPVHSLRIPIGVLLTHHDGGDRSSSSAWITTESSPLLQSCIQHGHISDSLVAGAMGYFAPLMLSDDPEVVATRLNDIRVDLNNYLRLGTQRSMVATSPDEATEKAFDMTVRLPGLLEE